MTIYAEEISTKCGSGKIPRNAFYCPADQQIYWSNTLGEILAPFDQSPRAGDQIMAHEFGHAVQGRTRDHRLVALDPAEISDDGARLELGRRTELQADCFAGLFIRSVSVSLGLQQADVEQIQQDFFNSGDDVLSGEPDYVGDHGTVRPADPGAPPAWHRPGRAVQHLHRPSTQVLLQRRAGQRASRAVETGPSRWRRCPHRGRSGPARRSWSRSG